MVVQANRSGVSEVAQHTASLTSKKGDWRGVLSDQAIEKRGWEDDGESAGAMIVDWAAPLQAKSQRLLTMWSTLQLPEDIDPCGISKNKIWSNTLAWNQPSNNGQSTRGSKQTWQH